MKKLLCLVISSVGLSACALPTYEPFNEYSNLVTAGSSIDLATSGFYVTNGAVVEQWGGGDSGFGLLFSQGGADVLVTNTASSVFTAANLASILPSGFPGAGADIDITAFIPQNQGSGTAGNSAVLRFAQDIPRPTNGVTTIYVSYLLDVTGNFNSATGSGNDGRFDGFLSQSNLYEGAGAGGAYTSWTSMFNTFGSSPNYVAYGYKINDPTITGGDDILACDSSGGDKPPSGNAGVGAVYNTANFVVGCFTFSSDFADTNTVWVNPPVADFGGTTPPASNFNSFQMGTVMSDVDGFFLESRSGGATGGIGPTFIGNLLIGHTWSYVTGGPEFTSQPATVVIGPDGDASLTGTAVAAAQNVTYQWQKIVGGATNNLSDGTGTAGGTAIVSGSQSQTLTMTNVSSGDMGQYQLVATASGTGFSLASQPAAITPAVINIAIQSPIVAFEGSTIQIPATVTAYNDSPMGYQWQYSSTNGGSWTNLADNASVTGSQSNILTLVNVQPSSMGLYQLVVTNSYGAVTSSVVLLTVMTVRIASQFPVPYTNLFTLFAGASPTFSVSATGTTLIDYQWFTNGVLDGVATNASFTLANVQTGFTNYCIVTNISGAATSTVWNALVILAPTAPYPQAVLADNPAGYWRLNEPDDGNGVNDGNDGAIAHDYVGGNDGIYTNTVLGNQGYNPTTDPTETSASFGENDISFNDSLAGWIQGVNFAESGGAPGEFTVEAWANGYNSGQISGAPVVAKGVYDINDQFSLSIDSTKTHYQFFVCDTNGIQYICDASNTVPLDNNWHHLVGVCDQANGWVYLYIDGRLASQASIPTGTGIYETPAPMTIGAAAADLAGQNFTYQFYGYVDDVAVYNYAMTASQVAAQYVTSGVSPYFTQPPPAVVVTNGGGPLVIPVAVIGTGPLNYIWSDVSGGTNIATGTTNGNVLNTTLAIGSVPAGWNNDQLELTVSGADGTTNMYVALTILTNAPQITQNLPAQVTMVSGKSYNYEIAADGMLPFGYQWYNAGTPLLGQTNPSETVTAGTPGSATYRVVITNIFGAATSTVSTFTSVPQLTNAYAASILALNPAGYWPLQETSAPAAVTMETNYGTLGAIGNAYYAITNAGDVLFGQTGALTASGDNDPCVYFPGTTTTYLDSILFVPRKVSALTLQPPLTLEAWAKANNAGLGTQDILGQGDTQNGVRMAWLTSGNGAFAAIFRNQAVAVNGVLGGYVQYNYPVPAPNQWYHCVLTFDGTNVNFYLNGVSQEPTSVNLNGVVESTTNATTTMSAAPYAPLTIGNGLWNGNAPIRPFNGYEDEVAVYTNVLSALQATNHYLAATTPGSNYFQTVENDHPLLYYRMDCQGYTNVSALYCPEAVNYGSAAPNGAYLSGVAPGEVAGPVLINISSISSNTVAAPINGEISCVDAGYDPAFNPSGSQPFTVMTWFRAYPADARAQTLMGHGGQNWTLNLTGSGLLAWSLYNGGAVGSTESFNDGNWHLAAGVYDGTNIGLYVDGQLNNSVVATGVMTNETNTHLYLGGNADYTQVPDAQQFFAGALAQAALFTNALSAAQIQAIYVSSQPVTVSTNPTNIVYSLTGPNQLTLSWPADHTGWTLQAQTNSLSVGLSTNWVSVAGSSTNNQVIIPINLTNGSVFYRLIYAP